MEGPLNEDTAMVPEAKATAAEVGTITSGVFMHVSGDNATHDAISGARADGEKEIAKPAQEPEPSSPAAPPQDVLLPKQTITKQQTPSNNAAPNLTNIPLIALEFVLSNLTAAEIVRITTSICKTLCSSEDRSRSTERSAGLALRSIVRRSWYYVRLTGTSYLGLTDKVDQICEESGLPGIVHWPDRMPAESIERQRQTCEFRIFQGESLLRTYHLHNALYRRAMQVAAEEVQSMRQQEAAWAGEYSFDAKYDPLESLILAPLTWLVLGVPILPPLTRLQFRALSASSSHLVGLVVPWNYLAERHADDPDPSPSYLRAVRVAALTTHSAPRLLLLADRLRKVGLNDDCQQLCNVLLYGHRAPHDVVEFWSSEQSEEGEEVEPCYWHDEYFLGHDVVVALEGSDLHGRRGTVERLYDGQDIGVRLQREEGEENEDDDDDDDDDDDNHQVHYLKPSQLVRSIPDRRFELDLIICSAMAVNGDVYSSEHKFSDHALAARSIHLLRDRSKALVSLLPWEEPADGEEEEGTPIGKRNSCVVHRCDQERLFFAYYALNMSLVHHGYAVGVDKCPPGHHGVLPTDEIFQRLYTSSISSPRALTTIVANWFFREAWSNQNHPECNLQLMASKHYYVMLADAAYSNLRAAAGILSRIRHQPVFLEFPPSRDVRHGVVGDRHLKAAVEKLRRYFEIIVETACRLQSKKLGAETIIRPSLDVLCQSADYPIVTSLAMVAHELYKLYCSASARESPLFFRRLDEHSDKADFLRFSAALSLRSLGRGHPLSVERVAKLAKERAAQCTISKTLSGQRYCYFPTGGLEQMEEKINKWLGNYEYVRFLYSEEYFDELDSSGNATLS